jgi:hypothetical protein
MVHLFRVVGYFNLQILVYFSALSFAFAILASFELG